MLLYRCFSKWIVFSESNFSIMYIIYIENNKQRKNIKSWIKHYGTLIDNRTKVYLNNISIIRLCKNFRFHILSSSADIQNLSIRKWAHCCFRLLVSIQAVCYSNWVHFRDCYERSERSFGQLSGLCYLWNTSILPSQPFFAYHLA